MPRYSSISHEELIRVCADAHDSAAWSEFVARFHRPISLSIVRTAYQWGEAPQAVLDDLVQETYLKLCADKCQLLLEFASQHPEAVAGYVKTVAMNVAHDNFKAKYSQKRGSGEIAKSLDEVDTKASGGSVGGQDAMEHEILLKQINARLQACSEGPDRDRDCLIFWLYYQQGMSAKAIAALPTVGLSPKGVESAIFRLTRMVREQIVGLQSEAESGASAGEKGFRPAASY